MHKLVKSRLLAGFIYGDNRTKEYVYLPGSELGSSSPVLVYEHNGSREDIPMEKALEIIEKRSLRQTTHPLFGRNTLQ